MRPGTPQTRLRWHSGAPGGLEIALAIAPPIWK
jgi:hypothetical protein